MRLIDADALLEEIQRKAKNGFPANRSLTVYAESCVVHAPTIEAIPVPCPIGSDFWWVDTDDMSVHCEKGGIHGFEIRGDGILYALDPCLEEIEVHSDWCCLTREEAEELRDKMKNAQTIDVMPVVHGRWVAQPSTSVDSLDKSRCSVCNYPTSTKWGRTNFCPNCGAKMDLE